jgi:hypothetical protein
MAVTCVVREFDALTEDPEFVTKLDVFYQFVADYSTDFFFVDMALHPGRRFAILVGVDVPDMFDTMGFANDVVGDAVTAGLVAAGLGTIAVPVAGLV